MIAVGISDLRHDSAAAVVDGPGPLAAFEEGKLSRIPRSGGLPRLALDYCLRQARLAVEDVQIVGVASRTGRQWLRDERLRAGLVRSFLAAPWRLAPPYGLGSLARVSNALSRRHALQEAFGPKTRVVGFEHHLCHAASAYYASEFDRALVLTLDEAGDLWSGLISVGEGPSLKVVRPLRFPNSLGWMYSQTTELLGFHSRRDEHKVQWLSQSGSPDFIDVFRTMFSRDSAQLPVLDRRFLGNQVAGESDFRSEFCRRARIDPTSIERDTTVQTAIARSAQDFLEETVVQLAEHFRTQTGTSDLCLAGGVFLNALLVRALEERTGFSRIFVQPVAGNAGTALGAAYLAQRLDGRTDERRPLRDLYLGPSSTAEEVKPVLDNCKIIYSYLPIEDRRLVNVVRLLGENKAVAWYQGRAEFGYRALGNRAIVASPFSQHVIENLNRFIKHRESFHPFALSVPEEDAGTFFDYSPACRFMASIGRLKSPIPALRAFAFGDQRVRVHVVSQEVNPRFWRLLRAFGAQAPAPILVNTSFNLFSEPLVCDPREAIRSFYCAGIDALAIEDFLIVKS